MDESVLSMVRCLYFVETFIRDGKDEFVFGVFFVTNSYTSSAVVKLFMCDVVQNCACNSQCHPFP